jgi:hypothetical protein
MAQTRPTGGERHGQPAAPLEKHKLYDLTLPLFFPGQSLIVPKQTNDGKTTRDYFNSRNHIEQHNDQQDTTCSTNEIY